ncbi:TetR/AcrR family transcriptional regulator [Aestuariibius sp. 2305UL40-4]|uniref:TetR/AcrR family transcriptional regulator n=1 Tax=Aestuariibius violaceus TaxID=3234132 RepID=UPI00345E5F0A
MSRDQEIKKRGSYHHGDLRAQLVEATRQLVEEKGPDHFTVSEACRVAGVSTAAPYKHFKDKEELLNAVTLEGMLRSQKMMTDELAKYPEGSLDRIVALGRVYIRFALQEPGVFRLIFGLAEDHADQTDLVAQGHQKFGIVQHEVASCLGQSEVGPEEARRAFLLWSFVHGLSFLLIDGKVDKIGYPLDQEAILKEIAVRVMGDMPDAQG